MREKNAAEIAERQIDMLWGERVTLTPFHAEALACVEHCMEYFSITKYTKKDGELQFSPLNTVQYAIYLYYLSHIIYKKGESKKTRTLIYYLNKSLHSNDWYYEVALPKLFWAEHPLGSVMGRGKYSDGFFFMQNCTIGGNNDCYPTLGKNVHMYSNSSILGNANIGNNVVLGAGTIIMDEDIPSNCLVFGHSPKLIIKQKTQNEMQKYTERVFTPYEK